MSRLDRRRFIAGLISVTFAARPVWASAELPRMTVSKDPNCSCCGAWIDYLKADGFVVDVVERTDMNRLKAELGVPARLESCHTARIGDYVVEGHVPADAIRQLLSEKPRVAGLAVPGMPLSAPGMDVPGAADVYDVFLFGSSGQKRFARYQGRRRI